MKPTWIIHYVSNNVKCDKCNNKKEYDGIYYSGYPYFVNAHTHGLNLDNLPELCICVDMGPQVIASLLNYLGNMMKKKGKFKEGRNKGLLQDGYEVEFIRFEGENQLYVILPDEENRFPSDKDCNEPYNKQYIYAKIIHDENMSEINS